MFKTKKSKIIGILTGIVILILVILFVSNVIREKNNKDVVSSTPEVGTSDTDGKEASGPMSALQLLEKDGRMTLCDADGNKIQLKGMSTFGLQWQPQILNNNAFAALKNDWGANVIRLALYVGENGYATDPSLKDKVIEGIDLAIANHMYVIVDWHVLNPGDPNAEVYKGAMNFFTEISRLYPNSPNIIYELANEPNVSEPGVTNDAAGWTAVKTYAEPIIQMLRNAGNENLIIVGSPCWSQRTDLAADDPIDDKNTIYSIHFYSGTHMASEVSTDRANVMSNVRYALEHGVAVFASEWGTSEASGDNGPFLTEADTWLKFFDENNISWCNWSLTNKDETSAAFLPTVFGKREATNLDPGDDQVWAVNELSLSGEYARAKIKGIPYEPIAREEVKADVVKHDPFGVATLPSDFEDGTLQGWLWYKSSGIQGPLTIQDANGSNAISWDVVYAEKDVADNWRTAPRIVLSEIKTTRGENNFLNFDFYLKPEVASTGSLIINLAFAPPDLGYWAQASDVYTIDLTKLAEAEMTTDGLYHYAVSFDINNITDGKVLTQVQELRDITIVIEDHDSDYQGKMYFDNVRWEK